MLHKHGHILAAVKSDISYKHIQHTWHHKVKLTISCTHSVSSHSMRPILEDFLIVKGPKYSLPLSFALLQYCHQPWLNWFASTFQHEFSRDRLQLSSYWHTKSTNKLDRVIYSHEWILECGRISDIGVSKVIILTRLDTFWRLSHARPFLLDSNLLRYRHQIFVSLVNL